MSARVHSSTDEIVPAKSLPLEPKPTSNNNNGAAQVDVEFVKCDCCGLTEECTPAYIARICERYDGRWICGLCSEAVKDEIVRSDRVITTEEALNRHKSFSRSFRASPKPPPNPKEHLISAMRQLLRRSLDSPRAMRSTPSSPRKGGGDDRGNARPTLARSGSCFPTIGG